jgi:hypothetical protein
VRRKNTSRTTCLYQEFLKKSPAKTGSGSVRAWEKGLVPWQSTAMGGQW